MGRGYKIVTDVRFTVTSILKWDNSAFAVADGGDDDDDKIDDDDDDEEDVEEEEEQGKETPVCPRWGLSGWKA